MLAKKEFEKRSQLDYDSTSMMPHGSQTIAKLICVFNTLIPGVIGDLGSYNLEFELVPYEIFIAYEMFLQHKTLSLLNHRTYEVARTSEAAAASALEAEQIKKEMPASMAEEAAAKEAEAAILAIDALAAKQVSEKEAKERLVEVVAPVAAVSWWEEGEGGKGKGRGGRGWEVGSGIRFRRKKANT
ncbi:hypothetical protein HDU79_008864 [Rhizoclosmatium sp. JEL0117]|nr:hypothetical protein HDU79_008864 [Rhizoclosmatium sp. JEL0117]